MLASAEQQQQQQQQQQQPQSALAPAPPTKSAQSSSGGPKPANLQRCGHCAHYFSRYLKFRDEKRFVDTLIELPSGQQLPAHKVILAATSKFFDAKLAAAADASPAEADGGILKLPVPFNDPLDMMPAVIDYLYKGSILCTPERIIAVTRLANELEVDDLKSMCNQYMTKLLTENAFVLLEPAVQFNMMDLVGKVVETLAASHGSQLSQPSVWDKVAYLPYAHFTRLLKHAQYHPKDENEKYKMVLAYVERATQQEHRKCLVHGAPDTSAVPVEDLPRDTLCTCYLARPLTPEEVQTLFAHVDFANMDVDVLAAAYEHKLVPSALVFGGVLAQLTKKSNKGNAAVMERMVTIARESAAGGLAGLAPAATTPTSMAAPAPQQQQPMQRPAPGGSTPPQQSARPGSMYLSDHGSSSPQVNAVGMAPPPQQQQQQQQQQQMNSGFGPRPVSAMPGMLGVNGNPTSPPPTGPQRPMSTIGSPGFNTSFGNSSQPQLNGSPFYQSQQQQQPLSPPALNGGQPQPHAARAAPGMTPFGAQQQQPGTPQPGTPQPIRQFASGYSRPPQHQYVQNQAQRVSAIVTADPQQQQQQQLPQQGAPMSPNAADSTSSKSGKGLMSMWKKK
ncbi:Kelch-like protein 17 [Sorochytrium milnesiophthora]